MKVPADKSNIDILCHKSLNRQHEQNQASEHPKGKRAPCKGYGTRCSGRVSVPCFTHDTCHRLRYKINFEVLFD